MSQEQPPGASGRELKKEEFLDKLREAIARRTRKVVGRLNPGGNPEVSRIIDDYLYPVGEKPPFFESVGDYYSSNILDRIDVADEIEELGEENQAALDFIDEIETDQTIDGFMTSTLPNGIPFSEISTYYLNKIRSQFLVLRREHGERELLELFSQELLLALCFQIVVGGLGRVPPELLNKLDDSRQERLEDTIRLHDTVVEGIRGLDNVSTSKESPIDTVVYDYVKTIKDWEPIIREILGLDNEKLQKILSTLGQDLCFSYLICYNLAKFNL